MDCVVLLAIGDRLIEHDHVFTDPDELIRRLSHLDITPASLGESLEVLEGEQYIRGTHAIGRKFALIKLHHRGADVLMKTKFPNWQEIERKVATRIVNNPRVDNKSISERLSFPVAVIDHVLQGLAARHLVRLTGQSQGGLICVIETSAQLRRSVTG